MPIEARMVAEDFLERQTNASLSGDINQIVDLMTIPYRRLSITHDALIETREQALLDIEAFRANMHALGVNLMHRQLTDARPLGPRYVEATLCTHLLKDATPMIPPFDARIVLVRRGDDWKMIELELNIVTVGWRADFRASGEPPEQVPVFAPDDFRGRGLDPMACYQSHLDCVAQAEHDDDFDAFCSYLRFPHTAHGLEIDNVLEGPDDVRHFFEMIKRTFNGDVGDRLERVCDHAEFLGSDLLVGYHTGRVYKNGVEVIEPVSSRMILQWNHDRWQLLSVANTIRNKTYPFDMYTSQDGDRLMTDMDIHKRTREWPNFLRKRTPRA